MEQRIIAVYCLIEEWLRMMEIKDDVRAEISNAEILLGGYMSVSDFSGNYKKGRAYALSFVNLPEYSRSIRRIHALEEVAETLFAWLGEIFMRLNGCRIYSVDSFPVELCQITREKRCRLWSDLKFKGYNASKRRFFYGLKVHMVVTTDKEPVVCHISKGSVHDITAAYGFLTNLPEGAIVIGDKGYLSNSLESFLRQFGVKLDAIFKKNMGKDNDYFIKRKIRKGVETAFSVITSKFGKMIKATSIGGFLVKLKLFILAYSIDCFLKLDEGKQRLVFN